MKKQILVIMPGSMELGGVERSLIGLLKSFDYDQYDVDLFLYGHHGPMMSMIDDRVNILPEEKELAYLRDSFKQKIKNKCYVSALYRLRDEVLTRLGRERDNNVTWAQVMRRCAKRQPKEYDLALSFFMPFDYLDEIVKAKVKIGWVHTDYSTEKDNLESIEKQYTKVDKIVAVSDKCKETFCNCFPALANRTLVIENILPVEMLRADAQALIPEREMPKKGIRLLSIGRYCTAKNFDNVPDICKRIVEAGQDVYWYIIGFGPDEQLIRDKIKDAQMDERVILLGKKENPYPYIKTCDLYVQPSRYEGKSVTVREAQMLGKPVVITNYATSASQLEAGVDGVIVPMDNEGCAEGIVQLLKNESVLVDLQNNCESRDYSNCEEVNKLYQLMKEYED